MFKRLSIHALLIVGLLMAGITPVHAQTGSILPQSEDAQNLSDMECLSFLNDLFGTISTEDIVQRLGQGESIEVDGISFDQSTILSCAIKSGKIKYWMLGFLIKDIIDFMVRVGALLSVLMIIVGGYYYMTGSLSDDKEKGKNTIQYAIIGLVISLLSWTVANLILLLVTS